MKKLVIAAALAATALVPVLGMAHSGPLGYSNDTLVNNMTAAIKFVSETDTRPSSTPTPCWQPQQPQAIQANKSMPIQTGKTVSDDACGLADEEAPKGPGAGLAFKPYSFDFKDPMNETHTVYYGTNLGDKFTSLTGGQGGSIAISLNAGTLSVESAAWPHMSFTKPTRTQSSN